MSDNKTIGCVICNKTNVGLKIYPYTKNGVIIALIYCCDDCNHNLSNISLTKNESLEMFKM